MSIARANLSASQTSSWSQKAQYSLTRFFPQARKRKFAGAPRRGPSMISTLPGSKEVLKACKMDVVRSDEPSSDAINFQFLKVWRSSEANCSARKRSPLRVQRRIVAVRAPAKGARGTVSRSRRPEIIPNIAPMLLGSTSADLRSPGRPRRINNLATRDGNVKLSNEPTQET